MPTEKGDSIWMIIKDLNPENTVLSRKKCPFIEISWTCYFHLHLGGIIRPNFNKRHGLQWITSAPRKPKYRKLNSSPQKSLVAHQIQTISFLLHNFPDAIFRRLLAESSNVFRDDVFFDGPSGEKKNGSSVKAPFWSAIYQPKKKLNVEGSGSVKMMMVYIPAV